MLRIYFLQQWYGLADEALEDAIYDSQAMRDFVGIDLSIESVPDATTLLRFRHLLERHSLTQRIFEEINASLSERGLFMREGTIVDATIIAAAPSTKNKAKQRDPSMKQTRKGNQWFFGMKAHIGVDAVTGLTHSVVATSANQADITVAEQLLRDGKEPVYADAGYTGLGKRLAGCGDSLPALRIAARRSTIKKMEDGPEKQIMQRIEHCKASIRAKVEHPFQEPVWPPQGTLPWHGEESGPAVQPVCTGQPGVGQAVLCDDRRGYCVLKPGSRVKTGPNGQN